MYLKLGYVSFCSTEANLFAFSLELCILYRHVGLVDFTLGCVYAANRHDECTQHFAVDSVRVSPLLSHVVADRRLLAVVHHRAYQPRPRRSASASLVALLLLLGGVESNPGLARTLPANTGVSIGLLNTRSTVHKAALI